MAKAERGVVADSDIAAGRAARHRLRAIVDEAVAMAMGGKRRDPQGRDVYEVMADAILADPLGAFAALDKLLPGGEKDERSGGAALNIGTLYLAAVQHAQPPGYNAGTEDAKVLELKADW